MVLSQINDKITYPELKNIDENDKGKEVTMFQINLLNVDVVIAIGDVKYDFSKNNVLYVPVYLIVDEVSKIYQIGVYEFASIDYETLLDNDGDLNISKVEGPLLYTFVDKAYLEKCMVNENMVQDYDSGDDEKDDDLDDDLDDDDLEQEEKSKEETDETKNPSRLLVELDIEDNVDDDDFLQKGESDKENKKIMKAYKNPEKGESQWIQQFMQNNNYDIENVKGDGNCFFYVVRNAFKSIGINATVDNLRQFLADNVNQEQFENYKTTYDMYMAEYKDLRRQIPTLKSKKKDLATKFKSFKSKIKREKDGTKSKSLRTEAKTVKSNHSMVKTKLTKFENELTYVKKNIKDVQWMKNIKNLDDLKAFMLSCDFWADAWAVPTLEELINTKIIVLSSEFYKKGKYSQVVNCGSFVSHSIESKGYFKPKYYIIAEHTGNHYKLIKYKKKGILRFHEIPYKLKNMLVEQCMKSSGKTIYNYIPKFAKLIGETVDVSKQPSEGKEDFLEEMSKKSEQKQTKIEEVKEKLGMAQSVDEVEMEPTPTPQDSDLYDENIEFLFHSKSANKKPGKGTGEKISEERLMEFNELAKIKDWRKILSNFYMKPREGDRIQPLFELDKLKWASVEHYYQGNKFKNNNPDYYRLFAIDSGSQIMDDPKKAKTAGGKTGKVSGKKFRPKTVVIDDDFFDSNNNEKIMEKGQTAKYQQDDLSKRVLLETKDAKLTHYVMSRKSKAERPPNIVFYDTMRIRNRLSKGKN